MENLVDKKLDDLMRVPGVQGVILADPQGLCVGHKGKIPQTLAGPIAALCDEPNKQWPSQDPPVIVLETETKSGSSSSLLVKLNDNVCTGILKEQHK